MDGLAWRGNWFLLLRSWSLAFGLRVTQVGLDIIKPDDSFGCGNYWCTMCIAAISLAFNE